MTPIDTIITELTSRLADPTTTQAESGSLLDREAGLALLFAELGHTNATHPDADRVDPGYRRIAHAYLVAANGRLRGDGRHSLFDGVPAVGFAASGAVRREGEYGGLLAGLDASVFAVVRARLRAERERMAAGAPVGDVTAYDVVSGLTGLGRYLLRRRQSDEAGALLRETLGYFALLVRPVERDGIALPGWWSEADPVLRAGRGHVNLGMAHGIAGPLALLSTAWRAGVRVPGQAAAIEAIVAFLAEWSGEEDGIPYWPSVLRLDAGRLTRTGRANEAWCYGRPGVLRAIQLAALALDRPDWHELVRTSVRDLPALPEPRWGIREHGLCHGWAGLLRIFGRIQHDDPATGLGPLVDRLAERTAAGFDPALRYGYRSVTAPGRRTDDPGFVTGAAGIALALHAYRTGPAPATGWDAALLLS